MVYLFSLISEFFFFSEYKIIFSLYLPKKKIINLYIMSKTKMFVMLFSLTTKNDLIESFLRLYNNVLDNYTFTFSKSILLSDNNSQLYINT